ncbi:MAG: peptidylprolyl isomerase [Pseudomonadota bacterium]
MTFKLPKETSKGHRVNHNRPFAAALAITFGLTGCELYTVEEPALATEEAMETPEDVDAPYWREVHAEDLVLVQTRHGVTAIELNISFAPNHAKRFRDLARAEFYDGEYFYRVIDGFVAQGGVQDVERVESWPALANENDRPLSFEPFVPLGNDDLFTDLVGHTGTGFATGRDREMGREWLLHCPGALAMARDTGPDTGSTEFYIVLGPQRYLDRNLTIFGRVIDGMEYIQALERGDREVESGVIQPPRTGDGILSVRIAADVPETDRPVYQVMKTRTDQFEAAKQSRRVREEDFFYRKPPEVLDVCGVEVPARRVR